MNYLKGKNILVTGGTGFIGSHLIEELIKQKENVVTTYQTLNLQAYFFSHGLHKKTTMVNINICNFEKVFDIVTKFAIDVIFHLAAQPLVDVAYTNPKSTLETNILGTVNILESARLFPKIRCVVVASSDKAYGKSNQNKYTENHPLKGDHPYEVSKSAADLISYSYFKTYGLPVVVTRFGNVYGQGDLNFTRIIPGIVRAIIDNKTLEIRSDGTFVRDYLYVKDVVRGYLQLSQNIDKVNGEAFNFGSNESLSVLQLIELVQKSLNRKIGFSILNTAKNEIPYQSLDDSKVKKAIGWKQQYSLSNTIGSIFLWYKKHFK